MDLSTLMPQQRDIVTTLDRPLFVSAGAGSGKTFTLTRRILWALSPESGPFATSLDQVLAITFTKDAAAEIRERVRGALIEAGMEEEALGVDDAWISTIHGMCSRILRAHALELGIDPEFAVAEEPVSTALRDEAVDRCIARLRSGEPGAVDAGGLDRAAFEELLAWYPLSPEHAPGGGSRGTSVRSLVARLLEIASTLPDGMDGIEFVKGSFDLSALMDAYRPLIGTRGKGAEIAQRALDACERFLESARTQTDMAELILACDKPRPSKAFPKEQVDLLAAEIADASVNGLLACGGAALEQLRALACAVEREYRALKQERALLDNGDLLRLTYEALRGNERIRAEYAGRFKMVMIDEFQDTDQQQVDLISFLTGEGGRALCTVGDAQQSIYRFRGAEVEVFRRQERELAARARSEGAATGPKHVELVRNFRSHAEVLRYVARVFDDAQGGLMPGFLDLESHDGRKDSLVVAGASRSQAFLVAGGTTDERTRAKAAAIAERFAALAAAGQPAGDMVLLLGAMTRADVYADAIRAAGLDCVISGGSVFSATEEARAIRALACALANPADTAQGLFPLLASPLFSLGAEEFLALSTRYDAETGETMRRNIDRGLASDEDAPGLEDLSLVRRAREVLRPALARVGADPIADIARDVVNESGWLVRLERAGAEGRAKAANVLKALDALAESEKNAASGPRATALAYDAFLTGKEAPGALNEGGTGAVRIMTVHASKGLEFPVVAVSECFGIKPSSDRFQTRRRGRTAEIVALPARFPNMRASDGTFLEGGKLEAKLKKFIQGSSNTAAWLAPELMDDVCATGSAAEAYVDMRDENVRLSLEERARLLYVAMTRAREALILAMDAKVGTGKEKTLKIDAARDLTGPVLARILPGGETALDLAADRLVFENSVAGDFELIALADFALDGVTYEANAAGAPEGAEAGGCVSAGCAADDVASAPGPADPEPDGFLLVRPAAVSVRVYPAAAPARDSYSYSSMARVLHEEGSDAAPLDEDVLRGHGAAAGVVSAPAVDRDVDGTDSVLVDAALGLDTAVDQGDTAAAAPMPAAGAATDACAGDATVGDATALGSAFHAAAQWLIETGAECVPSPRRRALARYWRLTEAQVERLDRALDRWELSAVRAELRAWPCVRAEMPFFSLGIDDAQIRERFGVYAEGAIDALATDPAHPERALVIDYKTGGSDTETPEELQQKHALQARVYADVLHKAGVAEIELRFVRVEREDAQVAGEPQVVSYRSRDESATMPSD